MTSRPLRIVHLEDDPLDHELVQARLRADFPDVELAWVDSRDAFIEALRSSDPDLILSDFALPNYDGMSALAAACELAPSTPFLFVSGAIGEERAIEALREGATDYVLKTRLDRLVPALRRVLREIEQRTERARAEQERDRLLVLEREARQAAEAANQMKDDFLAVASHELRTPLNAILGWAKILQTQHDPAMTQRGLGVIERNALAQARLIDDVLDVSRIVTGKLRLDRRRVMVAQVVDAAVEAVRPIAVAKNVALSSQVDEDVGSVFGDAERLQQIVWNLVTNAVKFTPSNGQVTARATREGELVEIRVIDDGAGIAPEALPRVFDRFFQVDGQSHTRAQRGLGLGLAIVRSLVELHAGIVSAESAGLGHGATFIVRIPVGQDCDASITRSDAPAGSAGSNVRGLRVLIVDDELDSLDLARVVLENNGAVVQTASSVALGLEAHATFVPDVIVCDIGMPRVDGYTLVRRVRQLDPKVPTIALTAFAREEDRRAALAAGFDCHLTKPADPAQLVATIARVAMRGRSFV